MKYVPEFTRKEIEDNRLVFEERRRLYKKTGLDFLKSREFILGKAGRLSGNVLEIGSGRGVTALSLARAGYDFTSIDNDKEMLKVTAMNLAGEGLLDKADLRVMNAYSLGFKGKSFDSIFVIEALHHMEDAEGIFREIDRVLSAGGKLVLADFNKKGRKIIEKVHGSEGRTHKSSRIGKREAEEWLTRHGYKVKSREDTCHWVIVAKKENGRPNNKRVKKYRYIYGPVPSWRLGASLGIDPISQKEKVCSFNCIYCQIGKTKTFTRKRKVFVPTKKIIEELRCLPPVDIDYLTFSGRGEPTLAENLGEMIAEVKRIRKEPVAVLTNSSMLCRKEARNALSQADFVVAKLDASSGDLFEKINRPVKGIALADVIKGIRDFRAAYKGKFALQIMFVEENSSYSGEIAGIARDIEADEVQLNTPLRPCAARPLSKKRMEEIEKHFEGLNAISVYKSVRKKVKPVSREDTLKRRGKV